MPSSNAVRTGDVLEDEIAGFVHGREFVFDAETTAIIGAERLAAIAAAPDILADAPARRNYRDMAAAVAIGAALALPMQAAAAIDLPDLAAPELGFSGWPELAAPEVQAALSASMQIAAMTASLPDLAAPELGFSGWPELAAPEVQAALSILSAQPVHDVRTEVAGLENRTYDAASPITVNLSAPVTITGNASRQGIEQEVSAALEKSGRQLAEIIDKELRRRSRREH